MEGVQGKKADENSKSEPKEILGLTTSAALELLQRDIKRVLDEYEEECRRNKYDFFQKITNSYLLNNYIRLKNFFSINIFL